LNSADITPSGVLISLYSSKDGYTNWQPLCSSIEWVDSSRIICLVASFLDMDNSLPHKWVNALTTVNVRTVSSGMFLSNPLQFRFTPYPSIVSVEDRQGKLMFIGPSDVSFDVVIKGQV
jgi:hypothetical protein